MSGAEIRKTAEGVYYFTPAAVAITPEGADRHLAAAESELQANLGRGDRLAYVVYCGAARWVAAALALYITGTDAQRRDAHMADEGAALLLAERERTQALADQAVEL